MSNGDNNVWAATSSTQGDALTYLNAKNITISRGAYTYGNVRVGDLASAASELPSENAFP